jgi:primosomal protein N' (replication factor Y)
MKFKYRKNKLFVHVKLLHGYPKILTYKIPLSWDVKNLKDSIITVPLKNKIVPALVINVFEKLHEEIDYEIKLATGKDHLPPDNLYKDFVKKVAQFYFVPEKFLYKRMRGFVGKKIKPLDTISPKSLGANGGVKIKLTSEQESVVDYVNQYVGKSYKPTLLYGATGSGKTEIYKKVIEKAFEQKKSVILLIPEVSLCLQFENIFEKQLPKNIEIFGFHSASTAKIKKQMWNSLLEEKPCLILGVHLPTLLPIPNLGCIIVDEEHESGFQEKKHPKISSKEVAIWRAKIYNIPIILGSATPSINSLHNVEKNSWKLFHLTKRFSGSFPKIKIVPIGKKKRKNFWITTELEKEIFARLEKTEQVIIFLNRRGYSFFVQCKQCGFTFLCPNCSVSLTQHKNKSQPDGCDLFLCCHYCDHKEKNPTSCKECTAPKKELLTRGIGTQQVVKILEELFPNAKIARADLDTTKKKRSWTKTLEKFEAGEIDIIVGTQTITKGYHFPRVTLVGILWADLNVHFPTFNASEKALQQLVQVAGRAGRRGDKSLVIAQVIHDHPIFKFLQEEDYLHFCKEEMRFRQETKYPPFGRFVQIEIKHKDEKIVDQEAEEICKILTEENNTSVTILGPTQPLVHRIQKTEIRHIFLKSKNFIPIFALVKKIKKKNWRSQIFIVPTYQ